MVGCSLLVHVLAHLCREVRSYLHRKCLDDAISAVNHGRIVLRGFSVGDPVQEPPALVRTSVEPEVPGKGLRVGDPVPESPALARTSVKPEVPWDYVRGVFLLVRPTPMFGSEATIAVPSLPCLGRGAPVLTPLWAAPLSRAA